MNTPNKRIHTKQLTSSSVHKPNIRIRCYKSYHFISGHWYHDQRLTLFIKNKIISQFFQISHDFCRTLQAGSDCLFIWPAFGTCIKPTIFMKNIKVVDLFLFNFGDCLLGIITICNNPVAKSCNSLVFWFMSYTHFGMKVPPWGHLSVFIIWAICVGVTLTSDRSVRRSISLDPRSFWPRRVASDFRRWEWLRLLLVEM